MAYLAYFGVRPEHFHSKFSRPTTNFADIEGEGHHSENPEPRQTMGAEGKSGHRDMPKPCRTMLTPEKQFSDLLELILRLRCHAVTLPTYTIYTYFHCWLAGGSAIVSILSLGESPAELNLVEICRQINLT